MQPLCIVQWNFNTSHVVVYPWPYGFMITGENFNTSHVVVYP